VTEVDGYSTANRHGELLTRRTFAPTPKGQRFLERWLRRPPAFPHPRRNPGALVDLYPRTRSGLVRAPRQQERLHRNRLTRLLVQREHCSFMG